jgi:O-antigen/teichoic acid export membrane protein
MSMILRSTLSLVTLSVGIYLRHSLIWGAAGLVISSTTVLLLFDIPVSLSLLRFSLIRAVREVATYGRAMLTNGDGTYRRLAALALTGVPLGLSLMLVSLNLNIPRYFVENSLGIREQGIFSSLANLMAAGNIVVNALGQCATPRLAKHFAAGEMREFRKLLWLLTLTSITFGVAGFGIAHFAGREVLTLIYRPEYATRQDAFIWLMAASGVLYLGSTAGVGMMAVRCFTPQLPLYAVSAVGTALASYIFVPIMGLRGAALAILISALIQCAGGAIFLRNACRRGSSVITTSCPAEL